MKTLFVSDLDGTLLQPDAQLSAETVSLLNESIADGKLFTIATARTPATVSPILRDINMNLPAIVMTGASIWDKQDNSYSNLRYIDPIAVKEFVDLLHDKNFPIFLFTLVDDMIHIYHVCDPLNDIEREFIEERLDSPFKHFHVKTCGGEVLPDSFDKTILCYGMQPTANSEAVYKEALKIPNLRPQFYHDIFGPSIGIMEAFSPLATKAEAIKTMKNRTGADRIIVFGDNINDLPMFKIADVAVAVENALPEVKAAADIVIGPNTDNSVAKFIHGFKP